MGSQLWNINHTKVLTLLRAKSFQIRLKFLCVEGSPPKVSKVVIHTFGAKKALLVRPQIGLSSSVGYGGEGASGDVFYVQG